VNNSLLLCKLLFSHLQRLLRLQTLFPSFLVLFIKIFHQQVSHLEVFLNPDLLFK
jgi:hypothetical protein